MSDFDFDKRTQGSSGYQFDSPKKSGDSGSDYRFPAPGASSAQPSDFDFDKRISETSGYQFESPKKSGDSGSDYKFPAPKL